MADQVNVPAPLTEFLLARIAEDEAAATGCPPWPWRVSTMQDETAAHDEQTYADETVTAADGVCVAVPYALSGPQTRSTRDHIVRHDPARVLAECVAKRQIVDEHSPESDPCPDGYIVPVVAGECPTVRALAVVYADHPDYREEWRS